jgi:predicted phage terminase large subunit-like protein
MGYVDTCKAIELLSSRWPKARRKLIEKKANGAAVIDGLQDKFRFVPIEPEGGKVSRANRCSELFEAGCVHLPESADWLQEYVDELLAFPQGANDDQVDCTSQALNHAERGSAGAGGLLAAYG